MRSAKMRSSRGHKINERINKLFSAYINKIVIYLLVNILKTPRKLNLVKFLEDYTHVHLVNRNTTLDHSIGIGKKR